MARKVRQMRRKGKQVALTPAPGTAAPDIDARGALILALIPVALDKVLEELQADVERLAGARYARDGRLPGHVRWARQRGSVYLADQKVPIEVPRVRDQQRHVEVPLPTYARFSNRGRATWACCTRCSAACRRANTSAAPRPCRRRSG